jgi:hypothetical protein
MSSQPAPFGSPIIIAGMHRSGTSLAASLLQSAGLDVGERLMEGNWSNPRGHFEDLDFVEWHKSALESVNLHPDGWVLTALPSMPADIVERVGLLVRQKTSAPRAWGFKDPRATLFLGLWQELIPDALFVFVHRTPWEVVDSLYRRGDTVFTTDPELAVQAWLHYARLVLDFSSRRSDRCFLVNIETIVEYPAVWVAALAERAGASLAPPNGDILETPLLHGERARGRATVLVEHFPEAVRLYGALESRAWRPTGAPPLQFRAGSTPEVERRIALQDWFGSCALEHELDGLRAELENRARSSEVPPEKSALSEAQSPTPQE